MASNEKFVNILSIELTPKRDVLSISEVGRAAVSTAYTTFLPVSIKERRYLLAYSPTQEYVDAYEFSPCQPWLSPVSGNIMVGKGKDILNTFTLGNKPYICTYTAKDGVFTTYSIFDDLTLSQPYVFYRLHELAISKGFSTVKFFTQFGQVVFLGYNIQTGYVAMYTAGITAVSPSPSSLPFSMLPIWSHPWAPGWIRFAFFQLGGENFFLKTNIANPQRVNVNIDHVLDSPASGTAEVGTHLNLAGALDLTNVEPFTLGAGEPHFAAYVSSTGSLVLYRFYADCSGWTSVGSFEAPPGAVVMAPIRVSDSHVFLLFS